MSSPIELYLGQLRAKLERRFDSECADQLLSEIRAHLVDSAAELEDDGIERTEAERVSVSRFGAPERAAFLMPLGQQYGTGDRYWGHGAFGIAIVAALGLTWYAFSPLAHRAIEMDSLRLAMTFLLALYAYACWRARSFAMVKHAAFVVGLIVMVTSLFRVQLADPSIRDLAMEKPYFGWTAELRGPQFGDLKSGMILADLGKPHDNANIPMPDSPPPDRAAVEKEPIAKSEKLPPINGMAPVSGSGWDIARDGSMPEVSQLLLSWLFLILVTNAAVCWIGCLEHEQKGGVGLVQ